MLWRCVVAPGNVLCRAAQVRNHIQRQKIDMASEVIDAGRFDMTTTMDERKATLEAMLQVPLAHTRTLAHAHAHT